MSNLIFVAGTFISLYLIGRKIGDIRIGILAAFILSFYPVYSYLSRAFLLENALCFMVTSGILFLLYTEGFSKIIPSFILGLLFGLGMLTKQTYIVFMAGPVFFVFFTSYFNSLSGSRRKILVNLFLSLFIGICISAPWYLTHMRQMFPVLTKVVSDSGLVPYDMKWFSWKSIFFYLDMLINEQITLFFFVLFILTLLRLLNKKVRISYVFLFIFWVLIPHIALTLFKNKFFYYTLPCLPAMALVTSCGLLEVRRVYLRRVVTAAVILIGFSYFFASSYLPGDNYKSILSIGRLKLRFLPLGMRRISLSYSPLGGDWKSREIVEKVVFSAKGKPVMVGVYNIDLNVLGKQGGIITDNYICADFDYFNYNFLLNKIRNCQIVDLLHPENYDFAKRKVAYIISSILLETNTVDGLSGAIYSLFDTFVMPDGSKVYLYKANNL